MALLRKFNYILDTVDNTIEKVSKDEVKVLLELGLVKIV